MLEPLVSLVNCASLDVARSSADEWDNITPYDRNQPGRRSEELAENSSVLSPNSVNSFASFLRS